MLASATVGCAAATVKKMATQVLIANCNVNETDYCFHVCRSANGTHTKIR